MTCEVSWLDEAVKWSKVATPILVFVFGFFINRNLNKQKSYLEREFKLKQSGAEPFCLKTVSYVDLLTSLLTVVQVQNNELLKADQKEYSKDVYRIAFGLISLKHEIEIYGAMFDSSSDILKHVLIADIEWRGVLENLKPTNVGKQYEANGLSQAQKDIIKALSEFQKKEMLGTHHE